MSFQQTNGSGGETTPYLLKVLESQRALLYGTLVRLPGVVVVEQGYGDGSTSWQILAETQYASAYELDTAIREMVGFSGWLEIVEVD